jgi:hypothetical protein
MKLGPFFFDTKELFLVLAAVLIAVALYFGWDLKWFNPQDLFILIVFFLLTKGLLPAVHNEAFFVLALVSILLTLYFTIFQVIVFFFVALFVFKALKVI